MIVKAANNEKKAKTPKNAKRAMFANDETFANHAENAKT